VKATSADESQAGSGTFQLSWPLVAGAASLVAVSSVAALIILIAIRQTDILSATALSLAILAFVLQLVVFIAQAWTSSQQSLHSQMLNTETRLLLTEVRASAQGMERMMTSQFERMLDHVLSSIPGELDAVAAKSDGGRNGDGDMEATLRDLRGRLHGRWEDEMRNAFGTPRAAAESEPPPAASAESAARLSELQSYPGEGEGRLALDVLRTLPPESVAMLRRYGEDEIRSLAHGERPGLRGSHGVEAYREPLVDAGLVRRQEGGSDRYQLTEAGRAVARLLVAAGDPPAYFVKAGPGLASVDSAQDVRGD
jgi:hypothetical protein